MKTIVFYVSEYGYGHATRSIALIRELLENKQDIRVILCNSFALAFMKDSLQEYGDRLMYHNVSTDVGYVLQKQTLNLDTAALNEACRDYLDKLPKMVSKEVEFLRDLHVDLILSDISPIAFEIAEQLHVPSIGISNFTWHTAYKQVIDHTFLDQFNEMYSKMDYFFSLAGSKEPDWGKEDNLSFGFHSRIVNEIEVQRIRTSLNPKGEKYIVFVPIGMKIDLGEINSLPLWNLDDCIFVVSSNMDIEHPNVHKIPSAYTEVQHYVSAADLVISKAGWGTISEAVGNGTSLAIINRPGMQEDQNTIQYLLEQKLCSLISWEELDDLRVERYINRKNRLQQNEVNTLVSAVIDTLDRNCKSIKGVN